MVWGHQDAAGPAGPLANGGACLGAQPAADKARGHVRGRWEVPHDDLEGLRRPHPVAIDDQVLSLLLTGQVPHLRSCLGSNTAMTRTAESPAPISILVYINYLDI
jgi:hypothetical protein